MLDAITDACREALALVEGGPRLDAEGTDLAHEGRNLLTILQAWTVLKPTTEDRATAIGRVINLHAAALAYASRRRPARQRLF